jgi:hypothetical protein
MSALNSRSSSLPGRSFGRQDSSSGNEALPRETFTVRRFLGGRMSLGNLGRPIFGSFRRDGEAALSTPKSDRPAIPTMMQPSGEVYSTPLPMISMVVLSIVSNVLLDNVLLIYFYYQRRCLGNSYLRMCRPHSCYSWSKVWCLIDHGICINY